MTVANNTAGGRERGKRIFLSQGSRDSLGLVRLLPKERANKDTTSAFEKTIGLRADCSGSHVSLLNLPEPGSERDPLVGKRCGGGWRLTNRALRRQRPTAAHGA
jgi:hypothetical protein